jgi:hypothetical protein
MKARPMYNATPTRNMLKTSCTYPDATYGRSGSAVQVEILWFLSFLLVDVLSVVVSANTSPSCVWEASSLSESYFEVPVIYDLRGFCIRFRRIASWNFRAPRIFSY